MKNSFFRPRLDFEEQLHLAPEQSWEFFICLDLGMESSYVLLEMERSWKIIRNKFFGLLKMDLVADVLNCMVLQL
ncbi:unnamed protein product [Rhizophagus irregularis]|nr:unnamed protein product [Rhizophagus irregularis]